MSHLIHSLNIPVTAERNVHRSRRPLFATFVDIVLTWQMRSRQRRELRGLDDAILRDVGISRAQANYDGNKPFWKP
jgi:uncharacterized protein YjiS (DUF1127 family)